MLYNQIGDFMKEKDKEKKIIFNESVDSSITGFSLVCALLITGIFLQFNDDFFGITTNIIKILFIIIGFIGLCVEIEHLNKKFEIKGFDSIVSAFICILGVFGIQFIIDISDASKLIIMIYNIAMFIFMFFAVYYISEGIIQFFYSIYIKSKDKKSKRRNIFSRIIITLTQLASLLLILAQIYGLIR